MTELTQKRLRELLQYDPDTGDFIWRVCRGKTVKVGDVAGYITRKGYVYIRADGKQYFAHRLVWLYVYGHFPDDQIDHINGHRNDNRFVNLRDADDSINHRNQRNRIDNKSGVPGVRWVQSLRKWKVNINKIYLGVFSSKTEAVIVRKNAELKLNFHPNHGNVTCGRNK